MLSEIHLNQEKEKQMEKTSCFSNTHDKDTKLHTSN